ncbi:MAG: hypothetical protein AAFV92_13345, partial [Pseudomonadota bacterium]
GLDHDLSLQHDEPLPGDERASLGLQASWPSTKSSSRSPAKGSTRFFKQGCDLRLVFSVC